MDFRERLKQALQKATDTEIRPGDESTLANNPLNATIDALNLPADWKQTEADYKQAVQDLPMTMGAGTMGAVKPLTGQARQAMQKLEMAKFLDKPLTVAEEMLLNKAQGKTVTVIPTAQEKAAKASEKEIFKKIKERLGYGG